MFLCSDTHVLNTTLSHTHTLTHSCTERSDCSRSGAASCQTHTQPRQVQRFYTVSIVTDRFTPSVYCKRFFTQRVCRVFLSMPETCVFSPDSLLSRYRSGVLYPTAARTCSCRRVHSDAKLKDPFSLAQEDLKNLYEDIKKVCVYIPESANAVCRGVKHRVRIYSSLTCVCVIVCSSSYSCPRRS